MIAGTSAADASVTCAAISANTSCTSSDPVIAASNLGEALQDMRDMQVEALPVIESEENEHLVGVLDQREARRIVESLGHGIAEPVPSLFTFHVDDPRLRDLLETREVGPLRVTMVRPALDSLERIVEQLRTDEPEIYDALGTAGALCARLIRGSSSSISNHSWGTAIDVKLDDRLDSFGDGGTQFGLLLLAELFNEEGWFWGATYGREDSMHFEISEEVLRQWAADGRRPVPGTRFRA